MTQHARFVDDTWDQCHDLGAGVALLVYQAGAPAVEHTCKTVDDVTLVVAPRLSAGHEVTWSTRQATVRPSVLCPDCGLHGFITAGRWEPV